MLSQGQSIFSNSQPSLNLPAGRQGFGGQARELENKGTDLRLSPEFLKT